MSFRQTPSKQQCQAIMHSATAYQHKHLTLSNIVVGVGCDDLGLEPGHFAVIKTRIKREKYSNKSTTAWRRKESRSRPQPALREPCLQNSTNWSNLVKKSEPKLLHNNFISDTDKVKQEIITLSCCCQWWVYKHLVFHRTAESNENIYYLFFNILNNKLSTLNIYIYFI